MIANIEVSKSYVFDGMLVQVTSVHDTRVNFIGFKLLKNSLGKGYFKSADVSEFTENARRVLL